MSDEMTRWVALLRGVNVGGGNKVPMADLRALAEELGWDGVRSYIASGNLVFEAAGKAEVLASDLRQAMSDHMGVDVPILVLSGAEITAAAEGCPFNAEGNKAFGYFCWEAAQIDTVLCDPLVAEGEALQSDGRLVWFHAPHGVGRSKLAEKMEKVLGVPATARNLNTIRKLADMVGG